MNPRLRILVPVGVAGLTLVLYVALTILFGVANIEWAAATFLAMLDRAFGMLIFLPRWASWAVVVFVLVGGGRLLLWENQHVTEGQRVAAVVVATIVLVLAAAVPPLIKAAAQTEEGAWWRPETYRVAGTVRDFDGISFAWVPAGPYNVGSPETEPGHNIDETQRSGVFEQGFWVSRYEISVAMYRKVMGELPEQMLPALDQPELPVTGVSYEEALAFSLRLTEKNKAKYRLPREIEWEYACRATTATPWSFGEDSSQLPEYGWFAENSGGAPHPVGMKKPNPWNIHDIYGNVAEWCSMEEKPGEKPKVYYRGGDWDSRAVQCRSAARGIFLPGETHMPLTVGIRLVRER